MGRATAKFGGTVAALLLLAVLVPSSASALTCTPEGYTRDTPYCFNAPGTRAPGPGETPSQLSSNDDARDTALKTCPDGGTFGMSLWMAVHPHAAGSLAVAVVGIDARLMIEDVATGEKVCSDDSYDEGNPTGREGLGVRGLEAGKTYLVAVGGRLRGNGSPATGLFQFGAGFVADPAGGGGGTGGGSGGGGGGTTTPGLAPDDPDPDMDGIRGAKDKCPGKGTRGRDINQDGCEDRKRQEIDVKWRIVPTSGRGVIMRELRLSKTRKGTTVTVKCSRGCKKLTLKPTKGKLNVSAKKLRAGRLKPGTTIEVSVKRPGYNGETHRFTVKKTTMTEAWTRCLPEGKSTPVKGACY